MNTASQRILDSRIIAIIRSQSPDEARVIGMALIDEGVDVLEVSLTTPDAVALIAEFASMSSACVGAGTVLTVEQAADVVSVGASFLVSPNTDQQVIAASRDLNVPMAAGVFTASDCAVALRAGAEFLKLFPASVGGVALMKALSEPFPQARWIPTGGVGATNAVDWWSAGACAVGVGSSLTGSGVAAARSTARTLRSLADSESGKG